MENLSEQVFSIFSPSRNSSFMLVNWNPLNTELVDLGQEKKDSGN